MRGHTTLLAVCIATAFSKTVHAQHAWIVDPVPVADIRATLVPSSMPTIKSHIIGATRLENGNVVIANDQAGTLSFYDRSGHQLAITGHRGSLTGDFRHIWWLGKCQPDSVFVWDIVSREMSVLNSGGTIIRRFPMPRPSALEVLPYTVTCSQEGIIAYQPIPQRSESEVTNGLVWRGRAAIYFSDVEGRTKNGTDKVFGGEAIADRTGAGPRPLGKRTYLALAKGKLYVSTGDSTFVDVYDSTGKRLRSFTIGVPRIPLTAAAYAEEVNDIVGSIHGPIADVVRGEMLAAPRPEMLPPFTAILTDPGGSLWVVASGSSQNQTLLLEVDEFGEVTGQAVVPIRLRVYEIGVDYILGRYTAGDGTVHVVVYRFRR
jgi:hypothetical protein